MSMLIWPQISFTGDSGREISARRLALGASFGGSAKGPAAGRDQWRQQRNLALRLAFYLSSALGLEVRSTMYLMAGAVQ